MYLYFNAQGKLVEIINDTALRKGNDAVDKVFIHFEDADYTEDCYLMVQRADGTHTLEYLVEDTITKQIPYDAKRDLKYFKDYTPYKFYVYTLQNTDLSVEGLTKMTIRLVNGSSTLALGLVTFNVENSVVKDDNGILQSQYDYILQLIQNKTVDQDNTITVLPNIPSDPENYEGRYLLIPESDGYPSLYFVDGASLVLQFHLSQAWADDLENRISQAEQDIDNLEANSVFTINTSATPTAGMGAYKVGNTYSIYANVKLSPENDLIKLNAGNPSNWGLYVSNEDVQDTIKNGIVANQRSLRDTVKNVVEEVAINNEWQSKDYIDNGLALKENKSEKGVANGYASLDTNGKVPTSQLPDSVLGQLEYKGTFNPNSGYPSNPELGWFYIAIADALISGVDYKVGDWAVYNGSSWDKVDNTDAVASVNGKLGAVILYGNEIQVGNGDTWTIEQRIVDIYAQLNDRYTKAQTYSAFEIEQKFAELMATSTLKDSAIPNPNGGFVFENYDNLPLSDISQYAIVMFKKTSTPSPNNVEWGTFKPLEMQVGNTISFEDGVLAFDGTEFYIDSQEETQLKFWGFKLDGITTNDIQHNGNNLKDYLDDLGEETYNQVLINAEQDKKLNEIQENLRKVASGEVSAVISGADIINLPKNTANAPMNVNLEGGVDEDKFVSFNKRIRSVGKNLFDKDNIIPNKWLNNTTWQEETPSSNPQNYCVSKYIVLEPNTTYRLGNRNTIRTKLFDKDLQPIASVSFSGGPETFTTTSDTKYIRLTVDISDGGTRLNALQLEKNTISTNYAPYTTSDLYLQANAIGYSLPNGVKDTIEYRNGKYYFVKRVDDTDLNNLVELSPYVETEIEAFGVLNGYENGVVYVDDIKFDADIYDNGIATQTPIKALESITKLVDGVETQLDINNATIALDKLSFTHTELNDGDIVWFTYEEDGDFYKGPTHITYYLDTMVRTSPDGSVWKLDWSVDNSGVITWTPTKI